MKYHNKLSKYTVIFSCYALLLHSDCWIIIIKLCHNCMLCVTIPGVNMSARSLSVYLDLQDLSLLQRPLVKSMIIPLILSKVGPRCHQANILLIHSQVGPKHYQHMSHLSTLKQGQDITQVNAPFVHSMVGPMHYHDHYQTVNISFVHYEVGANMSPWVNAPPIHSKVKPMHFPGSISWWGQCITL